MRKLLLIFSLTIMVFSACTQGFGKKAQSTMPAPDTRYIVVPEDISADYEVVGQIRLSSEKAANISELYQKMGNECGKLGGDMIINVQAGDQSQDTSKIHSLPMQPSDNPRFSAEPDIAYTWGTGTVIRLKDEQQRKAYFKEMKEGDMEGACVIIGVPPTR